MEDKKICSICGEYKPLDDFGYRRTAPDKRSYSCKDCARETGRKNYNQSKKNKIVVDDNFDCSDWNPDFIYV